MEDALDRERRYLADVMATLGALRPASRTGTL